MPKTEQEGGCGCLLLMLLLILMLTGAAFIVKQVLQWVF